MLITIALDKNTYLKNIDLLGDTDTYIVLTKDPIKRLTSC